MKRLTALLATGMLTLTACSNDANQDDTSLPTTLPDKAENKNENELKLGETIQITRCGGDQPCNVEITFTDIKLDETCPKGVSYPDGPPMDDEGTQYLTLEGEFHVIESHTNFSVAEHSFTAIDADGYTSDNLIAYDCENLGVDTHLSNPVDPGLKRKGDLILAIPQETETLRYSEMWDPKHYDFDVTTLELGPGAGQRPAPEESESPSESNTVSQSSSLPESSAHVLHCLDGTPGPALWSDGETRYAEQCGDGGEYAQQESDATAKFWECMEAGGTEETCLQG